MDQLRKNKVQSHTLITLKKHSKLFSNIGSYSEALIKVYSWTNQSKNNFCLFYDSTNFLFLFPKKAGGSAKKMKTAQLERERYVVVFYVSSKWVWSKTFSENVSRDRHYWKALQFWKWTLTLPLGAAFLLFLSLCFLNSATNPMIFQSSAAQPASLSLQWPVAPIYQFGKPKFPIVFFSFRVLIVQ